MGMFRWASRKPSKKQHAKGASFQMPYDNDSQHPKDITCQKGDTFPFHIANRQCA